MTARDTATTRQVAVLGTGAMGAPIARNIAKKGFAVRAWNRTAAKAEALAREGVAIVGTPSEAVRDADIVITMLYDGDAVLDVMRDAASGVRREAIWAQMSTVGIEKTAALVAFAGEHGLIFVDAPVQGSRQPAEQGQLVILASGPIAAREAVQPVFDAIGRKTLWLSENAAAGVSSRLKLALNHYALSLTHAVAESLRLARALGTDPRHVIEVVTGGPMDNAYFQMKGAAILAEDFKPSFAIVNAAKDARLIVEAARAAGLHADLAEASSARFDRALKEGHGDKDMAASFLVD